MAQRRTSGPTAAEPDFLQFNDLVCETVGGKVSHLNTVIHEMNMTEHSEDAVSVLLLNKSTVLFLLLNEDVIFVLHLWSRSSGLWTG